METLKNLAKSRNISNNEISRKTGLSVNTVKSVWGNGNPRLNSIKAICSLLGVEINFTIKSNDKS